VKVFTCPQGSPEWHQLRAGKPTASMFKIARAKVDGLTEQQEIYVNALRIGKSEAEARELADYKAKPKMTAKVERALQGLPVGDFSDTAKAYAFRLAVERISGVPLDEGFETWAMARGHELEPKARAEHEVQVGVLVQRAGFVTTDDGLFGCSADGLIGDDGGSEYKCLVSPDPMRRIVLDGDISDYIDQVQGCMWITGRRYWHFAMYCPALEPIGKQLSWCHVDRDEAYIRELSADMMEFLGLVDSYEAKLRGATPMHQMPEPAPWNDAVPVTVAPAVAANDPKPAAELPDSIFG
jgi:hypothetical protein